MHIEIIKVNLYHLEVLTINRIKIKIKEKDIMQDIIKLRI